VRDDVHLALDDALRLHHELGDGDVVLVALAARLADRFRVRLADGDDGLNAVPHPLAAAVALPYAPAERFSGTTRYGPLDLIRLSLDGLTAFTKWPLRAVSLFGLLLAIPALMYGGLLTIRYLLFGHEVGGRRRVGPL
jgi:hypothetical protein